MDKRQFEVISYCVQGVAHKRFRRPANATADTGADVTTSVSMQALWGQRLFLQLKRGRFEDRDLLGHFPELNHAPARHQLTHNRYRPTEAQTRPDLIC
jgi:hypothetical protein